MSSASSPRPSRVKVSEHRARLRMHDRRNGGNGEKAGADNTEGGEGEDQDVKSWD